MEIDAIGFALKPLRPSGPQARNSPGALASSQSLIGQLFVDDRDKYTGGPWQKEPSTSNTINMLKLVSSA